MKQDQALFKTWMGQFQRVPGYSLDREVEKLFQKDDSAKPLFTVAKKITWICSLSLVKLNLKET